MHKRSETTEYEQLRQEITSKYDSLSKRLKQIADFAWAHPTEMAMDTIAVIAKRAEVQPSAIIRFAKAFGFTGFSEMQRTFQAHVAERSASYIERVQEVDPKKVLSESGLVAGLLHQYVEANILTLKQLKEEVDGDLLERARDILVSADRIFIMAQRRSLPIGSYMSYALSHAGARVTLLDGAGGMLYEQSGAITDRDALLAVSFSPYSEDTKKVASAAFDAGVPVVAITDSAFSPLNKISSVCLQVQDAEVHSFRSLSASMCLAQALATSLAFHV